MYLFLVKNIFEKIDSDFVEMRRTDLLLKNPELKTKTVLDKMFALLPADITPTFLPILAAHVVERWKELTFKSAAA